MSSQPLFLEKVVRSISSAVAEPTWIVLWPAAVLHSRCWAKGEEFAATDPTGLRKAAAKSLANGHVVTRQAVWAEAFCAALLGNQEDYAVYAYGQPGAPVMLVGWRLADAEALAKLRQKASWVGRAIKATHVAAAQEVEVTALRRLLDRADRSVLAVGLGGKVIAASPGAREFLGALAYGPRHYFRREEPGIPPALVMAMAEKASGQVRLGSRATARFERFEGAGSMWSPAWEVEIFEESSASSRVRLGDLSPVEREILDLLSSGKTNPEIARSRGTSFHTVKNQVAELLYKTGYSRRTELIAAHLHPVPGPAVTQNLGRASSR